MNKYTEAKDTLRDVGYFVDILWNVTDVRHIIKDADEQTAQRILNKVLTSEYIMGQIWECIRIESNEEL
jgi:hypothetical protein